MNKFYIFRNSDGDIVVNVINDKHQSRRLTESEMISLDNVLNECEFEQHIEQEPINFD